MVPFRLEWGPLSRIGGPFKRNYFLPMPASLLTGMYQEWKVVQYDGIEVVQREKQKSSKCHTRQIRLARTAGYNCSHIWVPLLYKPIHFIAVTSAKDPANNEKYSLSNLSTNLELSSRREVGVMYWAYFKLPRCSLIHSCCLRANTTKDFTRTQTSLAVRKKQSCFFLKGEGFCSLTIVQRKWRKKTYRSSKILCMTSHSSQYITMSFCNKNLQTFFSSNYFFYQEKYKTLL